MKVLLVNGSPNKNGCTYTALSEIQNTLKDNDIDSEILYLGKAPLNDCIGCGKCRETGKCIFDDYVNETIERLDEFDGIIVGSPVYYAGPTGRICSFLDRLFYAASPKLQSKFAASIVSCRRGGASSSFDRLNKYFTINNMPIVPSQYWNSVHGNTPDEVRKDIEGLQTMRTLASNMAWLLKLKKIAEENGIPNPKHEEQIYTNFIK
ncbi:MAG: flavodoxin family protein [Peptostreptococcus sp.]|uniref:flavodoxin family protein n=1 Tax=Peptostreptococcus sp. TaxID=1262 RepID=UPI002FC7F811